MGSKKKRFKKSKLRKSSICRIEPTIHYSAWQEFLKIEAEIVSQLGIKYWDEYAPPSPDFLLKARKQQSSLKIRYELEIGKQLRAIGIRAQHQCLVLNRIIADYALPAQKIIIEADDKTHSEVTSIQRDEKKDDFVKLFGFKTFRIKHPYTQSELKIFCEEIKIEFVARGGILNNLEYKITRIEPKKLTPHEIAVRDNNIERNRFCNKVRFFFRNKPGGKKLKEEAVRQWNAISGARREEFERLLFMDKIEKKPVETVILRKAVVQKTNPLEVEMTRMDSEYKSACS